MATLLLLIPRSYNNMISKDFSLVLIVSFSTYCQSLFVHRSGNCPFNVVRLMVLAMYDWWIWILSCLLGHLYLMGPDWTNFRGYEDSCAWRFNCT